MASCPGQLPWTLALHCANGRLPWRLALGRGPVYVLWSLRVATSSGHLLTSLPSAPMAARPERWPWKLLLRCANGRRRSLLHVAVIIAFDHNYPVCPWRQPLARCCHSTLEVLLHLGDNVRVDLGLSI